MTLQRFQLCHIGGYGQGIQLGGGRHVQTMLVHPRTLCNERVGAADHDVVAANLGTRRKVRQCNLVPLRNVLFQCDAIVQLGSGRQPSVIGDGHNVVVFMNSYVPGGAHLLSLQRVQALELHRRPTGVHYPGTPYSILIVYWALMLASRATLAHLATSASWKALNSSGPAPETVRPALCSLS